MRNSGIDGFVFSWLLVAGGIIAVSLHSYFLLQGDDSFCLPVSLGLLAATFFFSLAQAIALFTLRNTRNQDDTQQSC